MHSFTVTLALWLCFILCAQGYIPATPTNDSQIVSGAINQSDTSILSLQWFPNASFTETISYQLVGPNSNGTSKGALVQFSEANISKAADGSPDSALIPPDFTTTPWIALISCEANVTNGSLDVDIFTLAKNRGAVSAILYSEWSDACVINPVFGNESVFNRTMDVFSTKSLIAARTIINAFTNVNQSLFDLFNATTLNQSASVIGEAVDTGSISEPNFLFAQLTANNASGLNTSIPGVGGGSTTNGAYKSISSGASLFFSMCITVFMWSFVLFM